MRKNYYPFASMPSVALLNRYERKALKCEKYGYQAQADAHWDMVVAGEKLRMDEGLDIYHEACVIEA